MMKQRGMQQEQAKQEVKVDKIIEKTKSKNELRKYQCMDCSYKFISSVFNDDSMCPYCGEKGTAKWIE